MKKESFFKMHVELKDNHISIETEAEHIRLKDLLYVLGLAVDDLAKSVKLKPIELLNLLYKVMKGVADDYGDDE